MDEGKGERNEEPTDAKLRVFSSLTFRLSLSVSCFRSRSSSLRGIFGSSLLSMLSSTTVRPS